MSGAASACPDLTVPALTLRGRVPDDLPTLWRWMHAEPDPEWQRWDAPYFHTGQPREPLPFQTYREQTLGRPASPHVQVIALGGACIGQVTRHEEAPAGGGWWELGLLIFDPQHWGSGLGTRALHLWAAATFTETDAHVLTLTTWGGNDRMIRAAARVGFRECARIPQARAWAGRRWDSVKLARLRG